MRNIVNLLAFACLSILVGCQSPCTGCRTCNNGLSGCGEISPIAPIAACPTAGCPIGSFAASHAATCTAPGTPISAVAQPLRHLTQPQTSCLNHSPASCPTQSQAGCSTQSPASCLAPHVGCPGGHGGQCNSTSSSCLAASQNATPAAPAAPSCDSPALAGGGHCGSGTGCNNGLVSDWQQSTGVDCALQKVPAAPIGSPGCTCAAPANAVSHNAAQHTAVTGPTVAGQLQCGCPKCTKQIDLSQPVPVQSQPDPNITPGITPILAPTLAPNAHGDVIPGTPSPAQPRTIEGRPVDGYPGKGCPIHGCPANTSPTTTRTLPRSLSGALSGGGFAAGTGSVRTSMSKKRTPLKRISNQVDAENSKQPNVRNASLQSTSREKKQPKAESIFDWKPNPAAQIESGGWSATAQQISPAETPEVPEQVVAPEADLPVFNLEESATE